MTLEAQISQSFSAKVTGTAGVNTLTSGIGSIPIMSQSYSNGSGAGAINKCWFKTSTLLTATSETWDLTSGLTDHEGNSVVFTGIKELIIAVVSPDGTKKVVVGNAASNSFQGKLSAAGTEDVHYYTRWAKPDAAGFTVDGTHKNLKINNPGGTSVTYYLMALGIG